MSKTLVMMVPYLKAVGTAALVTVLVALQFVPVSSSATPSQTINPVWAFQTSLYGRNVSGTYQFGVVEISYQAVFNATSEVITSSFVNGTTTRESTVTRLANGSFDISEPGSSSYYMINEFVDSNAASSQSFSSSKRIPDWLWAVHNQDSHSGIIGAYVTYQYTGGTFPCSPTACNDDMVVWLGFRTDTGYFFQVEAFWGHYTPGGPIILNAPIFSIGYDSQLGVHNVGQSIINHQYVMQISLDIWITGKWYFIIYDETAQGYVYNQPVSGATGAHLNSPYDLEVDMEGSHTYVDKSWIPSGQQNFYGLAYWDSVNTYHWVRNPQVTHTSDAPTNIGVLTYSNGNWITKIQWA